ncbi:MAG: hypothetical protein MI863_26870 [Desulfobacterales bacterium]|nr:hypothetical protein [Desulfobacterales bacterium]
MSFLLIKAFEDLLKDGFSDAKFRKSDKEPGEYCSPEFFIGALPPKEKGNNPVYTEQSEYPFILNRFKVGVDDEDDSTVTIHTVCGSFTAGDIESGENDVVNMVMRCRRLILERQMLEKRFELVLPLKWHVGDKEDLNRQAHPYYTGELFTTWRLPAIARTLLLEEEKKVYGA